jgi:GDPmannose 4,6-dehydratase
VFGVVKPKTDSSRLRSNITYLSVDITDNNTIRDLLVSVKPTHIYNFMGVTDVFEPWAKADVTYDNNFIVPLKIIENIKLIDNKIKFLQASSSFVFGLSTETPQNEQTERNPIYHYGLAKNFTDSIIKVYRDNFNLCLNSVILYPHESERRSDKFFSKKIIKSAIEIKEGLRETIEIGDVDSCRDIGYAKDYMSACLLIMEHDTCDDYIIGTGTSIKNDDFIKKIFNKLDINYEGRLLVNNNLKRGVNLSHLIADNKKIRKLGWEPKNNIDDIIDMMIKNEMNEKRNCNSSV